MIHYHGTPVTPSTAAAKALAGRHALVSFAAPDQLGTVLDVCQSFILDNGAYTAWKSGRTFDWDQYQSWVASLCQHPAFDWAIIPDVIDGDEDQNDRLIDDWWVTDGVRAHSVGVPVWHLHESLDRLQRLVDTWPRVALGSSGVYSAPGSAIWWTRMFEAMEVACDAFGRPRAKLHGLRMLDPDLFTRIPVASGDSAAIGQNVGIDSKWKGTYQPPSKEARAYILAERLDPIQSLAVWREADIQELLFMGQPA